MKVLFLGREVPYPADSGAKMRAWHVLRQLAEKHEVTLVCYGNADDKLAEELRSTCAAVHGVESTAPAKDIGLHLRMLAGLFHVLPYAVRGRYSQAYQEKVNGLLQGEKFDLVVSDSLYQAVYVPGGSFKTLLNEHNIESVIIERYRRIEKNPLLKLYASYELGRMKRFEDKVWQRFNRCFVCSEVDKQVVRQRVGSIQVDVIPNGMELPESEPKRKEREAHLVYTGLISWRPNEDAVLYFLEAIYPRIKAKVPGVTFSVVGKGPCSQIQDLARKDDSITVTGFVDRVTPYVEEASVFVVPLRIGSGTRLKILEALAMNKAVVSTSVGCEGLEVCDGKDIMITDTPEAFADCVVRLLKDEPQRRTLGENGRKLVAEKYNWERIGAKIEEILRHWEAKF